ncbi:MAG: LacI family DNA-binding transcriptional regulator [Marinilabiliaceae bacterium]
MSKPTISDIAKALNITPSTVSRALAGNPRVSEQTRQLVTRKAEELGYERNILASSLRKGSTDTVGLVVPRINRLFFSNVISGAEAILNPAGFNLIITQSHDRRDDERRAVQTLLRNQVSGILISHSLETVDAAAFAQMFEGSNVALVQFDRTFPGVGDVEVTNDNYSGAYNATKHLIEHGYRRIGHLGGDTSSNVYVERRRGFEDAMREAGMEIDETLMFEDSITRDKGFYNAAKALERGCDALYCAGDYAALGVVEYARVKCVKIPDEFGVVGTANEPFADVVTPSLSTLEQNAFDMGSKAAQAFLSIKQGHSVTEREISIPMKLIVRDSSLKKK